MCCVLCSALCVCGVWCLVSVCGAAWHAEKPPCVGSKRFRVYWQNARMLNTCARFADTHGSVFERSQGGVWNLHTGCLSLSRPFFLLSPSFSFLRALLSSLLSALLSSLLSCLLSNNSDNDHSSSRLLCEQSSDLPQCQSAWLRSLFGDYVCIMHETTVLV